MLRLSSDSDKCTGPSLNNSMRAKLDAVLGYYGDDMDIHSKKEGADFAKLAVRLFPTSKEGIGNPESLDYKQLEVLTLLKDLITEFENKTKGAFCEKMGKLVADEQNKN